MVTNRDRYNSPEPTSAEETAPLLIDSDEGKIGVLVCDESRKVEYLQEISKKNIVALFVPNYVGQSNFSESLQKRYDSLNSSFQTTFDRYNSDRLAQMGGSETHVYRAKSRTFEFNEFGNAIEVGTCPTSQTTSAGLNFSISYHSLLPLQD